MSCSSTDTRYNTQTSCLPGPASTRATLVLAAGAVVVVVAAAEVEPDDPVVGAGKMGIADPKVMGGG
jgi:hypothetical protein